MSRDRDETPSSPEQFLVKLRGFSNETSDEDIQKFLEPLKPVTISRSTETREVFVQFENANDQQKILRKDGSIFLRQKIHILRSDQEDLQSSQKERESTFLTEPVLRVSGVPITCTMADIQKFFQESSIVKNGIYISRDMSDNATGAAFVAFVDLESAERALTNYNGKFLNNRISNQPTKCCVNLVLGIEVIRGTKKGGGVFDLIIVHGAVQIFVSALDLISSSYEEAKKTILDDAIINGKAFAGEDQIKDATSERSGRTESRSITKDRVSMPDARVASRSNSRSRSKTKSRSLSRGRSRSRSFDRKNYGSNGKDLSKPRPRPSIRSRSPIRRPTTNEYRIKMRGMPFSVKREQILNFFPPYLRPSKIEILINRQDKRPNGDAYVYFSTKQHIREAMKYDRHFIGKRYVELYSDLIESASSRRHQSSSRSRPQSSYSSRSNHHRRSRSRNGDRL